MMELHVRYQDGQFVLPRGLEISNLADMRVKVVVTVARGLHQSLSRDRQDELRDKLLAGAPAELKVKIEHEPEHEANVAPVSLAKKAEAKLRAYWQTKGAPPPEQQERVLVKLGKIEAAIASEEGP
jgi:hypothetical protein